MPSIDAVGSLWWLVNRDRPLPEGYVPPDLVVPNVPLAPGADAIELTSATAAAFEAMAGDAAAAGHQLMLKSGYRSAQDQQALYERFVNDYGRDVERRWRRCPAQASTRRDGPRRRPRRPARRPGLRWDAGQRLGGRQRPPVRVHRALPAVQGRHHRLRQRAVAPALRRRRPRRPVALQRADDGGAVRGHAVGG